SVVADAVHEVDDLDRRLGAVRLELPVDEHNGAEADPAREDLRLAEGLAGAAAVARAEVEILREPEARERRRGEDSGGVRLRTVVEDVQDVDLLRLGRLRADLEQRAVVLARQLHAEVQRAVGARNAALNGERALELVQTMLLYREELHAL